ncbi:MAG: hypothetical protein ACOCWQ_01020 [Nanoarchaeota archaeon]
MGWVTLSSDNEILMLERKTRYYTIRIEARKEGKKWHIYHSRFNEKGLNLTDEYQAATKDEAFNVIEVIKKRPILSLAQLREKMLKKKRKTEVRIKRSYKEYTVEKWFFGISGDKAINFVVLRYYDTTEIDFVIHQRYASFEKDIITAIISSLGLKDAEEDLVINCYYFNRHTKRHVESDKRRILMGKLEFDFQGSD